MKRNLLSFLVCCLFATIAFSQTTTIGLIGEGTPNANWDDDVPMVQDPNDTAMWTLNVVLGDGPVKFRANNDWTFNWGNPDPSQFMSGIGEQGADNMQAFAGEYNISFNHVTGAYRFDYVSDIGMIGPATPNANWDDDVNMYRDQNDPNRFFSWVNLTADEMKFRKDDDWAVNWGSSEFPTGTAVLGSPDNLNVSPAAFYLVSLDTLTGAFSFDSETFYDSLGVIGEGTSNANWDDDIFLTQDANDGHVWTGVVELVGGGIKFRANADWATNWGGTAWPAGDGVLGGPDNIPTEAGTYYVVFNSDSGVYNFVDVNEFTSIGIIGTATPNEWAGPDIDMEQDPNDIAVWNIRTELLEGEAKFRANDDWAYSWGAAEFPAGVGELNGTINIPVTAGDYIISFNAFTGAYNFKEVVEYENVGIIGKSSPFANWDDDTFLTKDVGDFNMWTINSIILTEYTGEDDSGIKFRVDSDWAVNWGSAGFPEGLGTQDGANIECVAGDFSVAFDSSTGEYAFGPPSTSSQDIVRPDAITIFPNPTSNILNIDLEAVELQGEVKLNILNTNGQTIKTIRTSGQNLKSINVQDLTAGQYLINIYNEKYMISKRFSIAR